MSMPHYVNDVFLAIYAGKKLEKTFSCPTSLCMHKMVHFEYTAWSHR